MKLAHTYDRVAEEYARRIYHELDDKPFDRDVLDEFATQVRDAGAVYDLGCGPGHVTRYLAERGVAITGLDLSASMIDQARRLNPGIPFVQGDMTAIEAPAATLAGIVAMYSIIHFTLTELAAVFQEMRRVLRPGARLLVSFHNGTGTLHRDEWWGLEVSIDFHFFQLPDILKLVEEAGFEIIRAQERDPYPDVEYQSRRSYVIGRAL